MRPRIKNCIVQIKQVLFVLTSLFLFYSCDNKNIKIEEEKAFINTMAILETTNKEIEAKIKTYEGIFTSQAVSDYKIAIENYNKGIEESKKVSDQFLDNQQDGLSIMFRNNYVGCYISIVEQFKKIIEVIEDEGKINDKVFLEQFMQDSYEGVVDFEIKHKSYFGFLNKNQYNIFKGFSEEYRITGSTVEQILTTIENSKVESKKSYWRMFFRLIISSVIMILSIGIILLFLLGSANLVNFISDIQVILKGLLTFLLIFPTVILILYFCILWVSYCAYTVQFYIDSPKVTQHWIYYITGFILATAPFRHVIETHKHKGTIEGKRIALFFAFVVTILFILFITFSLRPGLMDYKLLSWLNNLIYNYTAHLI